MLRNAFYAFALAVFSMALAACVKESTANPPDQNPLIAQLASGEQTLSGRPERRKIEVFEDQASFNAELYKYILPIREESIDFSSKRVVHASLGARPSGGYSIAVESATEHDSYTKVVIRIRKPGPNCVVTQVVTSPWTFAVINSVKMLAFEEVVHTIACP